MGMNTSDGTELYKYKRLKDTADWLLSEESFVRWMDPEFPDSTAKVLWIHGPAGFGKSFLCARVVEYLSESLEKPLAWFFLSGDSDVRRDPFTALRSWIFQMLQDASVFDLVRKEWMKYQDPTATQDAIIRIFGMLVRHVNCTLVLDGLDECAVATDSKPSRFRSPISQFLDTISEAVKSTSTKILITSRADPEIQQNMPRAGVTALELRLGEANLKQDILLYARSIVDSALQDETESVKTDISIRLADRCQGQFLWLRLQHDELEGAHNRVQLEKVISETPSGLASIYERSYNKIVCSRERNRDRALTILRWTAFALRPLTVSELTDALLIAAGNETFPVDNLPESINQRYVNTSIVKICEGLIEVRNSTSTEDLSQATVHLQHFTVKEYLVQAMIKNSTTASDITSLTPTTIQHTVIATSCVTYLNFPNTWTDYALYEVSENQLLGQSFRKYASNYWMQHVSMADGGNPELAQSIGSFFDASNTTWDAWEKWIFTPASDIKSIMSLESAPFGNRLHYACHLNLTGVVARILLEQPESVHKLSPTGTTALYLACRGGFHEILEMLLDKGANVLLARNTGITPLQTACRHGHLKIVQALVKSQKMPADFVQSDNGALHKACISGNIEIVQFLIDHGADVSGQDNQGRTPAHGAAVSGNEDILRLLISHQAMINVIRPGTSTPIFKACQKGFKGIVKLLIQQGADVNAVSTDMQWAPLHAAAEFGYIEIIEMLIDHGADIDLRSRTGDTALLLAAAKGSTAVLKLLIDNKANVAIAAHDGWTPIGVAAEFGHKDVVTLLLEHGAGINVSSDDGQSPLSAASKNGHTDTVQLLLDNNAEIETATTSGYTALHMAADHGHIEIVRLMVEKGASMSSITTDGWYPMLSAIKAGCLDIVKLLASKLPDIVPTTDKDSPKFAYTPLEVAIMSGNVEIGNFLIDHGVQVSGADVQMPPPLCLAADRGHADFVQFLIDNGSDVCATDENGCSSLFRAAFQGHTDVVRLLMSKNADIEMANAVNKTPLSIASQFGHEEVVDYLLSQGAFTGVASSPYGNTALHYASLNGHIKVVEKLVKRGADLAIEDDMGRNVLFKAVTNNRLDVIQYLLKCGADPNKTRNKFGWTAVHMACKVPQVQALEELIRHKANITECADDGSTPLHVASIEGNTAIIDLLISRGVDVSVTDEHGFTALHKACELGHIDAVKLLVDHGANIHARTNDGEYPISIAAWEANMNVVEYLCQQGSDTNDDDGKGDDRHYVLMTVCFFSGQKLLHKHLLEDKMDLSDVQITTLLSTMDTMPKSQALKVVQTLLTHGAEYPINGSTFQQVAPLTFACMNENVELVELLLGHCSVDFLQQHAADIAPAALSSYNLEILQLLYDNGVNFIKLSDNEGQTVLHEACKIGAEEIASCLLQQGANITAQNEDGLYPIHSACQSRTWNTAQLLIIYGANPNMRSKNGETPLMIACQSGNLQAVQKLLLHYVNILDTNNDGASAIHFALQKGNFDVIELLLKRGANLNCRTIDGRLPLHFACLGRSTMVIEYLEHHGVDIMSTTSREATPLHFTATLRRKDLTEFFLKRVTSSVAVDTSGTAPLHVAASHGNVQVLKLLLEHGARASVPDDFGRTALYLASMNGHEDVTALLIESDAEVVTAVNTAKWAPLHAAAAQGHDKVVQLLIDKGAQVNATTGESGNVPSYCISSYSCDFELTELPSTNDTELNNQENENGRTPLHCAAEAGHDSVALLLLKNGAEVDVQIQETGTRALHHAAKSGNTELVKLLVNHGANISEPDDGGWTPLHIAALEGHLEAAKLLATSNTVLNYAEQTGWRPIHCAAKSGNEELVLFLLEKGADATVVDCNGLSPATIAQDNGHTKISQQISASSTMAGYLLSFF